jgi:hypothetical protein
MLRDFMDVGIISDDNDEHLLKQCLPMKITEFGMKMAVKDEHLAKQRL